MPDLRLVRGQAPAPRGRLAALLAGRCPRCREGSVFAGLLRMNPACPACGLAFEREPGYFTGAMYVSYALAAPLLALLFLGVSLLLPGRALALQVGIAAAAFLPLAPLVFRASRLVWIHLDRTIDPV